jgi:hypothetical protein
MTTCTKNFTYNRTSCGLMTRTWKPVQTFKHLSRNCYNSVTCWRFATITVGEFLKCPVKLIKFDWKHIRNISDVQLKSSTTQQYSTHAWSITDSAVLGAAERILLPSYECWIKDVVTVVRRSVNTLNCNVLLSDWHATEAQFLENLSTWFEFALQ